jgi:hypothetical protein
LRSLELRDRYLKTHRTDTKTEKLDRKTVLCQKTFCPVFRTVCYSYLLTEIRLTPGGSSTVHIYTKTVQISENGTHTTIKRIKWEWRAVPCLWELYPGICLTPQEKTRNKPQLLLYCDYSIWCVSCTVVVLTCFVMCGCLYV